MAEIPEGSSLDHAGIDRRTYEPPNCGSTKPHGQHIHTVHGLKNLNLNCPGALEEKVALDTQTLRMLDNVRSRNHETALKMARTIHDRAAQMIIDLTTGVLVTSSLTDLSVVLDTRLAALQNQHELTEIIAADGT